MTRHEISALFAALKEANPEPRSDLQYGSPFQLLVAVVLSAQATDKGVNKATPGLFAVAPDAHAMAALGEEGIRERIRSIGLFNTKARNIYALSVALVERFGGEVPKSREALESLPGVGRKSASVVLNVAFGEPVVAVDTHIFRVAHRLGLSRAATPDKVAEELERIIPKAYLRHAHHWLILHGRYVCQARKPKCEGCILFQWCAEVKGLEPPGEQGREDNHRLVRGKRGVSKDV